MSLKEVIDNIFSQLSVQALNPMVDGLYGLLPTIILLAVIVAIISLVIGFSSAQRGAKIGMIVGVFLVAFLLPFLPSILSAIMSGGIVGGTAIDPSSAVDTATNALQEGGQQTLSTLGQ